MYFTNLKAALIIPDGKEDSPAYLVFSNYEKILKWNRSLRFALAVCTLKDKIKDEIYGNWVDTNINWVDTWIQSIHFNS